MCRLRNIAMFDYQGSVTTGQTDGQTDTGQSDPYVPLCFAGDTKSEECMCRLRNIAMCDYQESVTTGQTHRQTDAGQSDPYVPLCFAGDTTINQQYICTLT